MLFSLLLFEEFPYIFLLSISIINSTVIRKHSLFSLHSVTFVNLFYEPNMTLTENLTKIMQRIERNYWPISHEHADSHCWQKPTQHYRAIIFKEVNKNNKEI